MAELVRNAPLQDALETWAEGKDAQGFGHVLRRALVGELLLDISRSGIADPAKGLQPGDTIAIASQVDNAGKRLLVAYSDNERLASAVGPGAISLGQPAVSVLEQAARDYEGVVIDPGHPGMFIAYADELRAAFGPDPASASRLATDLAERARPFAEFLADLAASPVYIAVAFQRSPEGEATGVTVQGATGPDGERLSPIFTSPAEVWAWAPGLEAHPTRAANVARVTLDEGYAGVIVNPAGPSANLPRELVGRLAEGERAGGAPPA